MLSIMTFKINRWHDTSDADVYFFAFLELCPGVKFESNVWECKIYVHFFNGTYINSIALV